MDTKRLLAVWAHPDDEAFGPVGTMKMAHDQGWRTAIITATRGDAGNDTHVDLKPNESLGDLRERELRASSDLLSVDELHVWRYHDGGLADVPHDELIERIREIMRAWQPAVVLTFGPDGITGHPDHVTISAATTEVFHLLRREHGEEWPRRLYYVTIPPDQTIEHPMGDAPPPKPITTLVDVSAYEQTKREALHRHASQRDDWEPQIDNHDWLTTDRFFRAFPPVRDDEPTETTVLHE